MKTITFYSYKGGVGRTLALANIARYLAKFGQRVFTLDLDLEAPGLHYKLDTKWNAETGHAGVVDYLHALLRKPGSARPLAEHVVEVDAGAGARGTIHLMAAGRVPSERYWRMLSELNWHEHFYEPGARGVLSFLELKARIQEDFQPDYLLIDARTGITETGGIATTVLPDLLVCLLVNNPENLEGARMVLRGVQRTPRLEGQAPVEILPVVTRLPHSLATDREASILEAVRDFLNAPAESLEDTVSVRDVYVLHSEPELEIHESVLVGTHGPLSDSPLLRDYLKLFGRIIPKEVAESYVNPLIEDALKRATEEPDEVEREIEALTEAYPHPESYLRLLKFYRLRRADIEKRVAAARRYWQLSGRADDDLLWEVVSSAAYRSLGDDAWFTLVYQVWMRRAKVDSGIGRWLVANPQIDKETKYAIARRLADNPQVTPEDIAAAVDTFQRLGRSKAAWALVEKHKLSAEANRDFLIAWARLVLEEGSESAALALLGDRDFHPATVLRADPDLWMSLQARAHSPSEAWQMLARELPEIIAAKATGALRRIQSMYEERGRGDEFVAQAQEILGPREAARLIDRLSSRSGWGTSRRGAR